MRSATTCRTCGPRRATPGRFPAGAAREAQADCYAGWWLGRSAYPAALRQDDGAGSGLATRLSRTLQVLGLLEAGGVVVRRDDDLGHGRLGDRVAAIRRGSALAAPWAC